ATVTLTGYIHPFSNGKSNSIVSMQVYKEADLLGGKDPSTATPIATKEFPFDPSMAADLTQFRACDDDPKIGCVPVSDKCMPHCADGRPGAPTDMNGKPIDNNKYCRQGAAEATCESRRRWERRYALDNIPTNTALVIRTTGEG